MNDSAPPPRDVKHVIDPRDESRIVAALEQAASTGDLVLSLTLFHRSHATLHRDATGMISQFAS